MIRPTAAFLTVLLAAAAVQPAAAADVQSARELVAACRIYAAKDENALRDPDPCRRFLVGFFTAYAQAERARQDALVKGLPSASPGVCVRLPDFLSYREMAQRVVNYGEARRQELDGPAGDLAQHTLERDFPCPGR